MMQRSPLGAALACLAFLWGALLPCSSEARLEASLGFGGCAPPERWVPLLIRGYGIPRNASVRVSRLAAEGRSLGTETFPALDGMRIESPVWTSGELEAISVALLSGDRALTELRIDAKAKPFPGHLVLACGLSARSRLAIASALLPVEPVLTAAVEPSELPADGLDYDAVSAVAIGLEGAALSAAQRASLLAWLAGGGRLCVAGSPEGGALEALGLPSEKGSYGLGRYAALERGRAESPSAWVEALALEPYDPAGRLGPGSIARAPDSGTAASAGPDRGAGTALALAAAAWLAAMLAAAFFGRRKAAPFAAVAAVSLACVLVGGQALDRAILRGASFRARALLLPGSGSAFLDFESASYAAPASLEWAQVRAIRSPSFAYADEESGGFGEWRHSSAKSVFSLRGGSASGLELEAMIDSRIWAELSSNALPRAPVADSGIGGNEPPELESPSPLAFLAPGARISWWVKEPGARWAKSEFAPIWLSGDEDWLLSLRGGKGDLALLAGRFDPGSGLLSVEALPLVGIRWAMPLPAGGTR